VTVTFTVSFGYNRCVTCEVTEFKMSAYFVSHMISLHRFIGSNGIQSKGLNTMYNEASIG